MNEPGRAPGGPAGTDGRGRDRLRRQRSGRSQGGPCRPHRRHSNLVYIDGKPSQKLTNDNLVDEAGTADPPEGGREGRSRCEPDRPRLTRLRTLREQVPASHSWHERHPAGADSGLALSGTHLRRPAGRLRLQRDPPAHPRVHRTLRPRHRRRHRRGRQGDVHLPRPQRRIPDHASGRYRRLRARRAGARPERRWSSAEALVHRADVPLRETAERSLPAVPPDRRGSLQPARSGHRRRVDHPHLAPVAEARHGRRGDPAASTPSVPARPAHAIARPWWPICRSASSNSTKTASGA